MGSRVPILNGKPWCPKWLVDRLGVDDFGHVTRVEMPNTSHVTTIAQIGRLAQLEELDLPSAHVSDAEMVHLRGLKSLAVLNFVFTRITDSGLAHLAELTSLKTLYLTGTDVTDAGLVASRGTDQPLDSQPRCYSGERCRSANCKGLANLTELNLEYTKISDAGLAQIKGLTKSQFSTFARRRSATPVWHI